MSENSHAWLLERSERVRTRYQRDIEHARRMHQEHGIFYADILADELEKARDREMSALVREYIEEKEGRGPDDS